MNIKSNSKKILLSGFVASLLGASAFGAAPTGTSAVLNGAINEANATITVTATDAVKFVSGGDEANATELSNIKYMGVSPLSALTDDTNTSVLLTFNLMDVGTSVGTSDIFIAADTLSDNDDVNNSDINITIDNITDEAKPLVKMAAFVGENELAVAFSEDIEQATISADNFTNITKDGSIALDINTSNNDGNFTNGILYDEVHKSYVLSLSTGLGDSSLNAGNIDIADVNDTAGNTLDAITNIPIIDMQEARTEQLTITNDTNGTLVAGDTIEFTFSETLTSASLANIQTAVNTTFKDSTDINATVTTTDDKAFVITFSNGANDTVNIDITTEKSLVFPTGSITDKNDNNNSFDIGFSIIQASDSSTTPSTPTEPIFAKIAEFDLDKDAQYSAGDTIYMQFDENITISELNISQVSATSPKTLGTGATISAVASDANISEMMEFTTPINDSTIANTFVLTLGTDTDVATDDNISIESDSITAFSTDVSFPLLAIADLDDLGAEVAEIRLKLSEATDMPADMREKIEGLLAEADVLLAATELDEAALITKLGEIYALVDTIGDEDAYLYGSNASKITGTLTLPSSITLTPESECFDTATYMPLPSCNAIFVDLKGVNGEWLGSTMIGSDGSYNLYFRELADSEEINATLEVHSHLDGVEEHYFYDFGSDNAVGGVDGAIDSIKSNMEIDWIEDTQTGMWNPNVNHLTISTAETTLNVDISNVDADKYIVEGTVVVPADFTPGEILGSNGEWLGFQNVNLTAINTATGDHYWTEIGRTATDDANTTYPFKFKLPNSEGNYTIRIEKFSDTNGATEWLEMYLNDGGDQAFGANSNADTLVGTTGVMWNEIGSTGIWIPDTAKTGYFTVSDNVSAIDIDITTFGTNFYKIKGTVTLPSDFTIGRNDNMNVDIIDAKTGWWLGGSPVMCDDNGANCTYSVVLGDSLNDYDGSGNGGYIIQMHQNHWDDTDWANSWWKEFYFDLGSDKAAGGSNDDADSIKDGMDVRWSESNELDTYGNPYWKPDVNEFKIANGTTAANVTDVNISFGGYTAPITYSVSGTITGIPAEAKWANVHMYDPKNYTGNGTELKSDGTYTIQNVKSGKYILEVHYDVEDAGNYKHYQYIITDDDGDFTTGTTTAVDGMDIRWIPYDSNGVSLETNTSSSTFDWETVSYWAPKEITNQKVMLDVSADVDVVSLVISPATFYNLSATINELANSTNVSFNLFVPNEPIGRWENNSSASNGTVTSAILKDLKARDDYQLQIWVDGLGEFWYDKNTSRSPDGLNSDVYWVGKQGGAVCDDWKNEIWSCDWSNPVEWGVNIEGFSISADKALNLTVPNDRATITAVLAMGADDANKTFDVNMWQHGGNNYAWESFEANASGDVTVSLSVKQGLDYRMEVYNPQNWEGFVVDLGSDAQDSGDESLITNQNSWATNGAWGPKTSTLIDLEDANLTDGVLDLGTLTPPTLKSVTFTVANLELDGATITEDIWIGLENNTTHEWYGNGNADWADWTNPTYSNEVSVKVPASSGNEAYLVHIYPMSHKGGMVDVNGSGQGVIAVNSATPDTATIDFTAGTPALTTWDIANADTLAIADDTNVSLTLKDLSSAVTINGTVTLVGEASESGWICAWNETNNDGQCTEVNTDGTYTIKGLSPTSGGDDYLVEYWANSGETFRTLKDWADIANDLTVNISFVDVAADLVTISGTVTDTDDAIAEIVLLEVQDSDSSWKVMDAIGIEDSWDGTSMSFEFTDLPPALSGFHYEIAVASAVITGTGVATYTITNSTGLDSAATAVTTVADDATVTITITQP